MFRRVTDKKAEAIILCGPFVALPDLANRWAEQLLDAVPAGTD